MRLTHLELQNWKNFTSAKADLHERVFVVGPNASKHLRSAMVPKPGLSGKTGLGMRQC